MKATKTDSPLHYLQAGLVSASSDTYAGEKMAAFMRNSELHGRCGLKAASDEQLPVRFCTVSELQTGPHLFFGDRDLDQFIRGLSPGQVIFLYGSQQCLTLSELLCLQVQLEPTRGGLNSKAIFIDGGNTFDPYFIAQYAAEKLPICIDQALDRILVSRAFTCHQLTSIITNILPKEVQERSAKLIIISDMIELYRDPDANQIESLDLFKITTNSLITTARLEKVLVLATSPHEKKSCSDPFLQAIRQRVDIVLRLEEGCGHKALLEKHPTRQEEEFTIKTTVPKVLEEFLIGD